MWQCQMLARCKEPAVQGGSQGIFNRRQDKVASLRTTKVKRIPSYRRVLFSKSVQNSSLSDRTYFSYIQVENILCIQDY